LRAKKCHLICSVIFTSGLSIIKLSTCFIVFFNSVGEEGLKNL
jgi:hypothetical protein